MDYINKKKWWYWKQRYFYTVAERYRKDLPSRWSLTEVKKGSDEQFYNDINSKYRNLKTYENSFNGRLAKSTAEALGYAGMVNPAGSLLSGIPKVGELAVKYPILTEKLSNAALSMGATYASNQYNGKETTTKDLTWSGTTGFITGGQSVKLTMGVNSASSALQAGIEGKDPIYAAGSSALATGAGALVGKGIEKGGYRAIVGNTSKNKDYYEPQYRTKKAMNLLNEEYNYLPNKIGVLLDSGSSQTIEDFLKNKENFINDLRKGNEK